MANISLNFQNRNRREDPDRVLLNFNFDEHELNNLYWVKCFYKLSRSIEPELWLQFDELRVLADSSIINKEIQFNFVRDTPFQQEITFKCELYILVSDYLSENFSLR